MNTNRKLMLARAILTALGLTSDHATEEDSKRLNSVFQLLKDYEGSMLSFNHYQRMAQTTSSMPSVREAADSGRNVPDFVRRKLRHCAYGLFTEGGELCDILKRNEFYNAGEPLTIEEHVHAREELGDVLWYIAEGASALGITLEEVANTNIRKLAKRYERHAKFDQASALIRDLEAEGSILKEDHEKSTQSDA